jgi:hypothetical protein
MSTPHAVVQRLIDRAELAEPEQEFGSEFLAHDYESDGVSYQVDTKLEARALKGVDFADMRPRLGENYVVKGLLTQSSLAAIIAASGAGKTFFACDLACQVAANLRWCGLRVRSGVVVYAALEGAGSAENRFTGWRLKHNPERILPLRMMPEPINLRASSDVSALLAFIKTAEADFGERCVLVVIDTLSRAMAGGDENGSEDMTALIAGADAIKTATSAAVVLVHHHGKDESRGARGHSSLKAALDTEIEITVDGDTKVATVSKQRDGVSGQKYAFKLEPVELGIDQDGDQVTSCVVEHIDDYAGKKKAPTGKQQIALLGALEEQHVTGRSTWTTTEIRALGRDERGMSKSSATSAQLGLVSAGFLRSIGGGRLTLTDPPQGQPS